MKNALRYLAFIVLWIPLYILAVELLMFALRVSVYYVAFFAETHTLAFIVLLFLGLLGLLSSILYYFYMVLAFIIAPLIFVRLTNISPSRKFAKYFILTIMTIVILVDIFAEWDRPHSGILPKIAGAYLTLMIFITNASITYAGLQTKEID